MAAAVQVQIRTRFQHIDIRQRLLAWKIDGPQSSLHVLLTMDNTPARASMYIEVSRMGNVFGPPIPASVQT